MEPEPVSIIVKDLLPISNVLFAEKDKSVFEILVDAAQEAADDPSEVKT